MDLKSFVAEVGGQTALAKKLGVTQGLVGHWLNNRSPITWRHAQAIEALSEGRITRHDLRPDIFGEKPDAPVAVRVA